MNINNAIYKGAGCLENTHRDRQSQVSQYSLAITVGQVILCDRRLS